MEDYNGETTTYGYDAHDNLSSIDRPTPLGSIGFGYNAQGEVTSMTDGRTDTTSYGYNDNGELTSVGYQGGGTGVALHYDDDGNLTSESNVTGDESFVYDGAGKVSSSDINGNSTSYTYDGNGNLSTLDGSGGDSTYTYTPESLVHTIVDPSVATTTFFYVSGHDQEILSVAFPDGVTENYGYDNAGRATSYVVTGSGSPAPTLISDSYSYTGTESSSAHDENKLASFTSGGVTWNYGYNANEYLASATSTDGGTNYDGATVRIDWRHMSGIDQLR